MCLRGNIPFIYVLFLFACRFTAFEQIFKCTDIACIVGLNIVSSEPLLVSLCHYL